MGKRKGDDVLVSAPTVVGDTAHTTDSANTDHSPPAWLDSASFDHKLWVVRETLKLEGEKCQQEDDFIAEVRKCEESMKAFQEQQDKLMNTSEKVKDGLNRKISKEEAKFEEESANVSAVERALKQIAEERDSLQEDMKDLERMRQDLEQRIATAMEEASQEVESINLVEENRKNQVPRLKHQISLYASTTGIKWNFDNDRLLEGHVVSTPS